MTIGCNHASGTRTTVRVAIAFAGFAAVGADPLSAARVCAQASVDGMPAGRSSGVPDYVAAAWRAALRAPSFPADAVAPAPAVAAAGPLAATAASVKYETIYNEGRVPGTFSALELDTDATGTSATFLPGGAVPTKTNAFFQSLGSNGRSCVSCHQPPSGMGVNPANISARYTATGGKDPIFQPVDGANCPNQVTAPGQPRTAFSLLLTHGVFRVFLPVPANAEYTVSVVSDPTTCNTDPNWDQEIDPKTGQLTRLVSVHRRPLITANLAFVNAPIPFGSASVAAPPAIMWDERESSLAQQASDATLIHAQATAPPTADQVNQMVQLELGVFEAQRSDAVALSLIANGASGGPKALALIPVGHAVAGSTITAFTSWTGLSGNAVADQRASIARGQAIFTGKKRFTISNVAGLGTLRNATCSTCHRQEGAANDPFGQAFAFDTGVGGGTPRFGGPQPATALPIFTVTCTAGHTTQYNGPTVTTNDPGLALITGKCTDIEKFKAPQLRSLANRAPYFVDGSAATLAAVVSFYDKRFSIGLSAQDQADLANFLAAL